MGVEREHWFPPGDVLEENDCVALEGEQDSALGEPNAARVRLES